MTKLITLLFFISLILGLSSNSWMMMWMSMEMNLMTFLFFIMKKKYNLNESTMKYFIIQSCGSLIFLFSISMNIKFFTQEFLSSAMIPPIALALKSGMAPLHSWMPGIVKNFNFNSLILFLTFQKIIPLFIMFSSWYMTSLWFAILSVMVGSLSGLNQSSLIKMLLFSSVNNTGWMIISLSLSMNSFCVFFLIYLITNWTLIKFLEIMKIKWMIQIKKSNFMVKTNLMILFLSLSGLPPFMGFVPKWIIIYDLSMNNSLLSFYMIFWSLLTLYFYIKMTSTTLMNATCYPKITLLNPLFSNYLLLTINILGMLLWITLT
uniref:NADH-ubiquinone oxidoreductase chain 2 n=1 Tax=Melanastera paucipunctata TaxID=2218046 RepID=A0A344A292_9HEMI|nr:NADH dehydrogenase subunit 2 [Diclidophlebia paucipunctata]AWU48883.1 NADH dehydrogenase subunit 2 [Diclidophlebia paucipunctata]